MNLVEQKLSVMPIGSPIRLTQTNGQIIEGVVSANDTTQALEVTITAKITLRYSQISGIEESNAFGNEYYEGQSQEIVCYGNIFDIGAEENAWGNFFNEYLRIVHYDE